MSGFSVAQDDEKCTKFGGDSSSVRAIGPDTFPFSLLSSKAVHGHFGSKLSHKMKSELMKKLTQRIASGEVESGVVVCTSGQKSGL